MLPGILLSKARVPGCARHGLAREHMQLPAAPLPIGTASC